MGVVKGRSLLIVVESALGFSFGVGFTNAITTSPARPCSLPSSHDLILETLFIGLTLILR